MPKQPGIYPLHQTLCYNPPVAEVPVSSFPKISSRAVVGTHSMVIGDVTVADDVFIGFHNIIRSDSSYPMYIGELTNIQDFVLIHCHPSEYVVVDGKKMGVYIDKRVSILHHSAPHGPLYIGCDTFIGQHASIYGATIGRSCVIMHGAVVTNHVKIADGRFVAPGQAVFTQVQADALPPVPDEFKGLNAQIVDHYYRLGKSYKANTCLVL